MKHCPFFRFATADPPVDVIAGNAVSATTIGIATGSYSQQKLQEAGVAIALPTSLSDLQTIEKTLST